MMPVHDEALRSGSRNAGGSSAETTNASERDVMTGSRQDTPRSGDRPSLDALNRTIEGLEARIEGLLGKGAAARERPAHADVVTTPLSEIIERQRMLSTNRDKAADRQAHPGERPVSARSEQHAPQQFVHIPVPPAQTPPADMAASLQAIRSELNNDITARIGSGLAAIKSEISDLGQAAQASSQPDWLRQDIARITAMLEQSAHQGAGVNTETLIGEMHQLRAQIGQPARQDSLDRLEDRWSTIESALDRFDPESIREEIVSLAWRLDEMKSSLGDLTISPAIRSLEDKLIMLATAVESLGKMQPDDQKIIDQFEGLDRRLDEISRAIAASARSQPAMDPLALQRLEDRLGALSGQISDLPAAEADPELAQRIDRLSSRLEEIAAQEAALRLDERLTQISNSLERYSEHMAGSDISLYLAELTHKIEELGDHSVPEQLIERMEQLSRRIEEFDLQSRAETAAVPQDDDMLARLESRLVDIVARLDDTVATTANDPAALKGLENQIANLSALINQPQAPAGAALPADFEHRMTAIEDYLSSNDEYILEAARQAAETVVEAYSRNPSQQAGGNGADIAVLSGLAEDLRALEEFSRSSEERTYRTFEALHDTLIQIAERLNSLDIHVAAQPDHDERPAYREEPAQAKAQQPAFGEKRQPASGERQSQDEVLAHLEERETQEDEAFLQAGIDDLRALQTEEGGPSSTGPASGSVIASLGRKLLPSRKTKSEKTTRTVVEPTPALDATDLLPAEIANELMEPGTGAPDVRKILERVKAGKASAATPSAPDKADIIAAARRAAEAAAADVESDSGLAGLENTKPGLARPKLSQPRSNRRPILLAVGAVLLVIMSYPLVSNLIKGPAQPETATVIAEPGNQDQANTTGDAAKIADQPTDGNAIVEPAVPVETSGSTTDGTAGAIDDEPSSSEAVEPVPGADIGDDTGSDAGADPAGSPDLGSTSMMEPAASTDTLEPLAQTQSTGQAQQTDGFVAAPVEKPETAGNAAETQLPQAALSDSIEIPAGLSPASLGQAAKSGDPLALFEIGARYTEGRNGVELDLKKAAEWYALSAQRGFAPAEYRLANFREKGTGVDRDIEEAKRLYLSAAQKGNASAMHNLAVLYATGSDGTPDFAQASKWFEAAANHGVADSQFNLAILYARGNGVTQDLELSYKWFAIAALAGDKDAAGKRDEVANAMKPEQLEAAKAATALWKAVPLDPDANSITVPDEWIGKGKTTATVDMKKAIRNIQTILNNNGFGSGTPDGELGEKTLSAIKAFQKSVGQEPTGRIDDALVRELLARNKKA